MDGYNWLLGDKRQTQPHYAKASCQSLDTYSLAAIEGSNQIGLHTNLIYLFLFFFKYIC